MKLTFVDAGVLIAAARGGTVQAARAMEILDDPACLNYHAFATHHKRNSNSASQLHGTRVFSRVEAGRELLLKFDQREWVNDIIVGAITGAVGGAVMAMLVPNPPVLEATGAGGIVGLVTGMLIRLLKWLLDLRPPQDPEDK